MEPVAALDASAMVDSLRRRVEELETALAEVYARERHLRAAMEASRVVAYEWDLARDRVLRLRGTSTSGQPMEDAGDFETVVGSVYPEDRERFRADIAAALAAPDGAYRTEIRCKARDGTIRWLSETGRVLRGPDGRPERVVGITFDINDRKQAEEALRRAEEQLREQGKRKDEFLAMLAHELRNPLAPIRNAAAVLRLSSRADSPTVNAAEIIERQVAHLTRLVDDLLDVSRVSRGKLNLQMAAHDLRDAIQQALEVSRPLMQSRRHVLELSMPPEPVLVHGDLTRLAQVFANVLNNAAKYTDVGGHVALELECRDGQAIVRVRDNGRGLDPACLEQVFEPFYQAERDLDRAEGGLGLGLALVRHITALHGGSAQVESAGRGRGCNFLVRLPRTEPAPALTPHAAGTVPASDRWRVLIVDDNRDAAESMAQLLRLAGHEVDTAFDGHAAIERASQDRPDLVLLDIGLPDIDGYEVSRRLRERGLRDTLIAALTGFGQPGDRRASQEAGFDAHFVKPVDIEQVAAFMARSRKATASSAG